MQSKWPRRLFVLGGCAGIVAGFQNAPAIWDWYDDNFEFEPLDSPPGFRRLAGSAVGEGSLRSLFAGIGDPPPDDTRDDQIIAANLCDALFADGPGVPVAAFSDYYCPYCRILDRRVMTLADEGLITLRHHETPIFGDHSVWAARGAIAARRQGQGRAYFDRMIGTSVIATPSSLRQVADDIGLDAPRFFEDMTSDNTDLMLREAASLQRIFGFLGTPALVVGQTVLQGVISETNLRQLIKVEQDERAQGPCA